MTESTKTTRVSDDEWDRLKSSFTTAPEAESEQLFAEYIDHEKYDWCFEPSFAGKSKKPDFVIRFGERLYLLEVKERSRNPTDPSPQWIDPMQGIREEIEEARRKFKEYSEFPCSLVIFNPGDLDTVLEPDCVFGAMLGDPGITMAFDEVQGRLLPETARNVFMRRRGKMKRYRTSEYQNTRINAVIVLQKGHISSPEYRRQAAAAMKRERQSTGRRLCEDERAKLRGEPFFNKDRRGPAFDPVLRVVVCKNPGASALLPQEMFRGPHDVWYEYVDGGKKRTYVGGSVRRWR